MLNEKTGIGPGLMFMVVFVSLFSYGVLETPHAAAKYIGNNGYWGFLLAFCIAVAVIYVICKLGRRFPNQSVIQYLPDVMGIPLGKLLGFIYLVVITILMIWASRAISELLHLYFLFRTPMWASVFIFLAVSAFVSYQGIEGVSRLAAFLFPVTFFFSFLAILFSFQNFDLGNIRPIFFVDGFKIPLGSIFLFYPFISLLTVPIIFPYLTQKKKGFKTVIGAAALACGVMLMVIVSAIGNYSAPGVLRYSWPVLEVVRKANLPYVVQTFGLFYAATWLSQALAGTGYFYYVLSQGIAELIGCLNYKWLMVILFPVIYTLIMLPSSVIDVRVVFPSLCVAGFTFTLALPLMVWVTAICRKRGNA